MNKILIFLQVFIGKTFPVSVKLVHFVLFVFDLFQSNSHIFKVKMLIS